MIDAYAVPGLPTTVFIGADGIVMDKFTGGFVGPAGEKALVMRLDRLLGTLQAAREGAARLAAVAEGNHGQRGILCTADYNCSAKGIAASDDEFIHEGLPG